MRTITRSQPLISVLLPTYNQARFLQDALEGLASQKVDFQLIACDDGSTDQTPEILKRWGVRTVTHPQNRGTAAAINSARELTDAQYLTWVSSDNIMYPNWLATLRSAIRVPGVGAVYSAYRDCPEGGFKDKKRLVKRGKYNAHDLISGENCYFGPSFLIRSEVWQEHRGQTAHDYDSWLRVEEACWMRGLKIAYVPEVLCDYKHGDWNTVRRRPDLYDAPRWRAEALDRRCTQPTT